MSRYKYVIGLSLILRTMNIRRYVMEWEHGDQDYIKMT